MRFSGNMFLRLAAMLTAMLAASSLIRADSSFSHTELMSLLDGHKDDAAVQRLVELRSQDAKFFADNNYDYLLGRLAEAGGNFALAIESYSAVAERDSILKAYALYHLAEMFGNSGNRLAEGIYLRRILIEMPQSLLANAARIKLAESCYATENFACTAAMLTAGSPQGSISDKALVRYRRTDENLLGLAKLRSGDSGGIAIMEEVIASAADPARPDDAALTAARALDAADIGADPDGTKVGDLSEAEHLRRAGVYQFNREFALAKPHFEAAAAKATEPAKAADALFRIGRGFAQARDHVEALKWFERIREQYADTDAAKESLLQAAASYARVGKPKEAKIRYEQFIRQYSSDEKLDRAYLNIVDVLRDQGDDIEALKWAGKAEAIFSGKPPAAAAVFNEVKIHLARSDWPQALAALDRLLSFTDLGGSSMPGGTDRTEVTFLKGYVLEQQKHYDAAVALYLSIADTSAGYYGWRASERLHALAGAEDAKPVIAAQLAAAAAGLNSKDADARRQSALSVLRLTDAADLKARAIGAFHSAISTSGIRSRPQIRGQLTSDTPKTDRSGLGELLFLGLYDEAAGQAAATKPPLSTAEMNDIYLRGDRADLVMARLEPQLGKAFAELPPEMTAKDSLALLYPTPFAREVLSAAKERRIDPRFVYAIMRQESRFAPDAASSAAARGLMQFTAPTARRYAEHLGFAALRQEDLFRPKIAIGLGSAYLFDLFAMFPEHPASVAASYNGGEDNVKRWAERSRSNDTDVQVPEFVFSQTKDYVHRVMSAYRVYCYLYDEELEPID